jgi:hypothetical protein
LLRFARNDSENRGDDLKHPRVLREDPRLARLPTEEEIAAQMRRRPIGAVIVDICCDLGIAPGHLDRAFWDEISHAVITWRRRSMPLRKARRRPHMDDGPDPLDKPGEMSPP